VRGCRRWPLACCVHQCRNMVERWAGSAGIACSPIAGRCSPGHAPNNNHMQVKRCDEMARKLRFFHDQVREGGGFVRACVRACMCACVLPCRLLALRVAMACGWLAGSRAAAAWKKQEDGGHTQARTHTRRSRGWALSWHPCPRWRSRPSPWMSWR